MSAFNAEQVMKRSDLNDMFGNIMSSVTGFSPNIMAVPKAEFEKPAQNLHAVSNPKKNWKRRSRRVYPARTRVSL